MNETRPSRDRCPYRGYGCQDHFLEGYLNALALLDTNLTDMYPR